MGSFPHDPSDFTQGLLIHDGVLYESTGLYGRSRVYRKELRTGKVLDTTIVPREAFGEGLALSGDRLFQLTWREGVALVYGLDLSHQEVRHYTGEGWGLAAMPTPEGEQLVLSDGSAYLRFFDPATFEETGRVTVMDDRGPVGMLNELEYVRGEVLANVWKSDRVEAIDPATGRVAGWYDLSALKARVSHSPGFDPAEYVLNGLALDPVTGHVFATGKDWPTLFELELSRDCR